MAQGFIKKYTMLANDKAALIYIVINTTGFLFKDFEQIRYVHQTFLILTSLLLAQFVHKHKTFHDNLTWLFLFKKFPGHER